MAALSEFVQDGIRYVPTKAIAKSVDLSPDYLTRFCREGKVAAVFHKGAWYVSEASLTTFLADEARRRDEQNRKLSEEAKQEVERLRAAQLAAIAPVASTKPTPTMRRTTQPASLLIGTIAFLISLAGVGLAFEVIAPPNSIARENLKSNFAPTQQQLAAVSSLPWFDSFADTLFRTICPIFRDCPRDAMAAAPQPRVQITTATTIDTQQLPPKNNLATESATSSPAIRTTSPQKNSEPTTVITQPVIERVIETVRTGPTPVSWTVEVLGSGYSV